jgi:transposase
VLLANCLAHGRRQFVEVADNFPDACRHVLEALAQVYQADEQARAQGLSPEERLCFHQAHSGPVMDALQAWLAAQLDAHQVEPNSGLGRAIRYLLRHWEPLTLFLRQPGVPLDNNIAERALKKAILNRKNAYFYRTENGARVGDLYMTLIHTCELNGVNAFEYLTELQRHTAELATTPSEWLPWTYRDTLTRAADSGGPAP